MVTIAVVRVAMLITDKIMEVCLFWVAVVVLLEEVWLVVLSGMWVWVGMHMS